MAEAGSILSGREQNECLRLPGELTVESFMQQRKGDWRYAKAHAASIRQLKKGGEIRSVKAHDRRLGRLLRGFGRIRREGNPLVDAVGLSEVKSACRGRKPARRRLAPAQRKR